MPRKSKDIGLIVKFDDKEYTDEEKSILWAQLFCTLAKIDKMDIPESFIQKVFSPDLINKLNTELDSNSENTDQT